MDTPASHSEQHPNAAALKRRRNLLTVAVLALVSAGFYVGHLVFRLWGAG